MHKNKKDPLAQAAKLLNENAPEGEALAYINSEEADVLKQLGGGEPVNSSGVPSFFLLDLFGGGKEPPPLPEFDAGKSARDYVSAMADSGLQDQLLQVRQQYDPQYQDLQIGLARRAADPMADLAEQSALRSQKFGRNMAMKQADSDISLMNRFGRTLLRQDGHPIPLCKPEWKRLTSWPTRHFRRLR